VGEENGLRVSESGALPNGDPLSSRRAKPHAQELEKLCFLAHMNSGKAILLCGYDLIAGNVYLFAASQGLAAWFHNCNKGELSKILKLRADQHVLFGQTVGYLEKD
jgi:hypothetical protein